jgi:isoquinoline 1-oxidoreductase alpha subunit
MISLTVNGKKHSIDVPPDVPLLWVIRDHLKLTGSKYSCGEGVCGACTVHINGKPTRSCITRVGDVKNKKIVTIEGLPDTHPLKLAWIAEQVPQCGYCQPGQIMEAAALLKEHPKPTESQIESAMNGHLCRCGTYQRIKKAIHRVASAGKGKRS